MGHVLYQLASSAASSQAQRAAVEELLGEAGACDGHYGLLPRKIRTLYRRGSFGLTDRASEHVFRHCFVPLTERTLDGRGFFPCSIYLRYGGPPIAPLAADSAQQQAGIVRFVKDHSCVGDEICRGNCSACCRDFNLRVNQAVRDASAVEEARRRPGS